MKLKFSISHLYTFFFSVLQDVDAILGLLHKAKVNNMLTNTISRNKNIFQVGR